jgi:hypothetical protein
MNAETPRLQMSRQGARSSFSEHILCTLQQRSTESADAQQAVIQPVQEESIKTATNSICHPG